MYSKEQFPNPVRPRFESEWSVTESPVDFMLRQPRDVGHWRECIYEYARGAIGALSIFRQYASPEDQATIDKHIAGFEEARVALRESAPIYEVE
jgi:hypothetical protein